MCECGWRRRDQGGQYQYTVGVVIVESVGDNGRCDERGSRATGLQSTVATSPLKTKNSKIAH